MVRLNIKYECFIYRYRGRSGFYNLPPSCHYSTYLTVLVRSIHDDAHYGRNRIRGKPATIDSPIPSNDSYLLGPLSTVVLSLPSTVLWSFTYLILPFYFPSTCPHPGTSLFRLDIHISPVFPAPLHPPSPFHLSS